MNSGPETVTEETGEGDVTVVRHWGVQYNKRDPKSVRWDPGYGSGVYVPYSEAEARADAENCGGAVVTRTETTIVVTTPWKEAS